MKAIKKARKCIDIVIFRFDHDAIERALVDAVERGVAVRALIAFTNRGGEKNLRKLETHFLAKGITVARTAGDLIRYHGKMMIVDRHDLYLLAFNFTHLDIDHSRSFGLVTRNRKLVQQAINLFEADSQRQSYEAGSPKFLVSPLNARKELAAFIKGAKKQLLIYDPKIGDRSMIGLLRQRLEAGVEVCVIGSSSARGINVRQLGRMRLHARVIIRDRKDAFLGSQSLRTQELDARREIGLIFRDAKIVKTLRREFREDWKASEGLESQEQEARKLPVEKAAKKVAKAVAENLAVDPVVKKVVKAIKKNGAGRVPAKQIETKVKAAVRDVVGKKVEEATAETVRELADEVAS
ncbi:MAG: phospholipase D-like domain-containing protein [Terriglobia bacterium]|nr:phospholipase D-like domain-containing protein [Terriglobia bacterium]